MSRGRRPRAETASTRRIEVRVTEDEYREIRRLAHLNGASVGEWLRYAAVQAADDMGVESPQIVIGGRLMITSIIRR
ncbi:MAG: hypothetical protein IT177_00860 [Acidobacteria bacterium]|nr:hypothetical protein [Acidobacteriota bacterium]